MGHTDSLTHRPEGRVDWLLKKSEFEVLSEWGWEALEAEHRAPLHRGFSNIRTNHQGIG